MELKDRIRFIDRKKIDDNRGWFLKVINGLEENLPDRTGEIYLTSALPGESKGGHYHEIANEWFTLVTGECELKLADIKTGEKLSVHLSHNRPLTVYVPSQIAHIFVNQSKEDFILIAYSDQLYLPEDTIMFDSF